MTAATIDVPPGQMQKKQPTPQGEPPDPFDNWFSRCRATLHFTACLILKDSRRAERAVRNCWMSASGNPPLFEREGAFRSWIVRILISEALSILDDNRTNSLNRRPTGSPQVRQTTQQEHTDGSTGHDSE
jgi:DNA-directed RNA polymerase specialized sigma24 family protein